ncbi:MAG: hypothetical protein ACM4AI_20980 [Acidobacteriota bacterium]
MLDCIPQLPDDLQDQRLVPSAIDRELARQLDLCDAHRMREYLET